MVSLRRHFVPNPVSFTDTRSRTKCNPPLGIHTRYDAYSRLIRKTVAPDGQQGTADLLQTAYVYDGNQIVLQFDRTGTGDVQSSDLSHRYLWGPAVDQILADETVGDGGSDDVLWPLVDHQGTVRDLAFYDEADAETSIANHVAYNAFGRKTSETNAAVDCVFAYTGRLLDDDTGLQNHLHRWYDPETAKWLSEDPIGFEAGDANLTRWVGNAGTTGVDPDGLQTGTAGTWTPGSQRQTADSLMYLAGQPKQQTVDATAWPSMRAAPARGWLEELGAWWGDVWNYDYIDAEGGALRPLDGEFTSVVRRFVHNDAKPIGGGLADAVTFVFRDVPVFAYDHLIVMPSDWRYTCDRDMERLESLRSSYQLLANWDKLPDHQASRIFKRGVANTAAFAGMQFGVARAVSALPAFPASASPHGAYVVLSNGSIALSPAVAASPNGAVAIELAGVIAQNGSIIIGASGSLDGLNTALASNPHFAAGGVRPTPNTSLPGCVTGPAGGMRTPEEVAQARNFFERNRDAARQWWEQRTGRQWPSDATHYEHPVPLKNGGDPLFVEPGYGGPNARHMVPGPDGLTDSQRWGRLGGRPPKQ